MRTHQKREKLSEKVLLEKFLLQRYVDQPIENLLICKTRKCQFKMNRGIGYICTMKLPESHPDQEFQGRKSKNRRDAERSAAAECLRFVVDETELATTTTFDWKSHLNIFLMQQLNQTDIAKKSNAMYQVTELGEGSVALYLACLTLPTLLPGREIFGQLSRSKRQAEQSVAEKVVTNVELMDEIVHACAAISGVEGGMDAAKIRASKVKRWQKYKAIQFLRDIKQKQRAVQAAARAQGRQRRPPPVPAEARARYRFHPAHLGWQDTLVMDRQPTASQLGAYHEALRRNLLLVLPRGQDRSVILSMWVRRILLSVPGDRRFAVLVAPSATEIHQYAELVGAAAALRVYAVTTHRELSNVGRLVAAAAFDVLVISGELLLIHLRLSALAAIPAQHLHLPDICCLAFLDCLDRAYTARILLLARACPVKPRLLGVTSKPAPTVDMGEEVHAALLLVQQKNALQWMFLGAAMQIPVTPPLIADVQCVFVDQADPVASGDHSDEHAAQRVAGPAKAAERASQTPALGTAALLDALQGYGSSGESDDECAPANGHYRPTEDGAKVVASARAIGGEEEDEEEVVVQVLAQLVRRVEELGFEPSPALVRQQDDLPKLLLLTSLLSEKLCGGAASGQRVLVYVDSAAACVSVAAHLRARFAHCTCIAAISSGEQRTTAEEDAWTVDAATVVGLHTAWPAASTRSATATATPPCNRVLCAFPLGQRLSSDLSLPIDIAADLAEANSDRAPAVVCEEVQRGASVDQPQPDSEIDIEGDICIDDVLLAERDEVESGGGEGKGEGSACQPDHHEQPEESCVTDCAQNGVTDHHHHHHHGALILVCSVAALVEDRGPLPSPSPTLAVRLSGDLSYMHAVQLLCGLRHSAVGTGVGTVKATLPEFFAVVSQRESAEADALLCLNALMRRIIDA